MENYINLIVAILSGLVTAIPLVVQLVKYVRAAIQEKNWSKVLTLVLNLMTEAERAYASGEERKVFVMNSIESIKDTLNYQVDMNQISEIIDQIVASSKVINAQINKPE